MKFTLNDAYSYTSVGRRKRQEDARYPDVDHVDYAQNVYCVCDGVGGSSEGQIASGTVAETIGKAMRRYGFGKTFQLADFHKVLDKAYDSLDRVARNNGNADMATTLTFLSFNSSGVTMAHIGDSRIYHLRRDSGVLYRSEDHSLVSQMVHHGAMTPEEAEKSNRKNVITRCMEPESNGYPRSAATFIQTRDVRPGDVFFLCSDGVYGCIDEDEMINILLSESLTDEKKIEEIMKFCTAGSTDNFTATLVCVANVDEVDPSASIQNVEDMDCNIKTTMRLPKNEHLNAEVESVRKKRCGFLARLFSCCKFAALALFFSVLSSVALNVQAQTTATAAATVTPDSIAALKANAVGDNVSAQMLLAEWYFNGTNGLPVDKKKALQYWALAAKQGNVEAIGRMAECYHHGWGTAPDSLTAVKLYKVSLKDGNADLWNRLDRQAKEQNDLLCTYLLIECCQEGIGTNRSAAKANEYQKIIAKAGNVDSQYAVALYCLNANESAEALTWFERAAESDHTGALYYSGLLYFRGQGTTQNKQKGISYFQRAVEKNFAAAQYQMGRILLEGDGMKADPEKAFELLEKAANADNVQAKWLLGMCYIDGRGTKCDFHMATVWLAASHAVHKNELKALVADKDHTTYATYLRGLKAYDNSDYDKAQKHFKKVKKAHNPEGRTMIAACKVANTDGKRRARWAMKYASCRSYNAKYMLSQVYLHGQGTKRNSKKGLALLKKAAGYGIPEAVNDMGILYMTDVFMEKDFKSAASSFLKAEVAHCLTPEAARQLADLYRQKVDVLPDLEKAEERIKTLEAYKKKKDLQDMLKLIK